MSITNMWSTNAAVLTAMIIINILLMSLGNTYWLILGILVLLGGFFISFDRGMQMGHAACSISHLVSRAQQADHPADALDDKTVKKVWSLNNGVRGLLLSVLIPYASSCLYILCMKLEIEPLIVPTRLLACVMALPYWGLIADYSFPSLATPVIAILMISPFVQPLVTFAGYMRGPRLWQNTEKAMAEGRRRAKAKARIANRRKTRTPREQKPQI